MKKLPNIVGILLGLLFLMASVPILFGHMTPPPLPEGTPASAVHFNAAFWDTGYVKFVKVFEFTGALVVMIPRLRNIGLLLLGPVIVNIIAYHLLIGDPKELSNPMMIMPAIIIVCMLYLLWNGRQKFAGLLN